MPIPGSGSHGNLYVEYKVILPLELSPKMHKSKSLPPSMMVNLVPISDLCPLGLDRAFNGDHSEDKGDKKNIRDEL